MLHFTVTCRRRIQPILFLSFSGILLILLIFFGRSSLPPSMMVGARIVAASRAEESVTILWRVKNTSEITLSFDENRLAQVTFNHQDFSATTGYTELSPGEETCVSIYLNQVDFSRENSITIRASTNQGTQGATVFRYPNIE